MPTVIPFIPQTITVHLGRPDQPAENVTVSFQDYVKNVASSEIYPTWEPAAIRANVLAIISFALNRIYTEYYPSRGYDFQITSTTAYDQKFIRDRDIFENISTIVDEIFNDYIRNAVEARDDDTVIHYEKGPYAEYAVPTDDHYLPLIYILGAADPGEKPTVFNNVCNLGALAMTGFAFGI